MKDRKKRVKEAVKRYREKKKKTEGSPNIKGVDKPSRKQAYIQKLKAQKKQKENQKHKAPVMVGPKGGTYTQGASGKKQYKGDNKGSVKQRLANEKQKHVKKALENFLELGDLIKSFIAKFKGKQDEQGN